MSTTTRTWTRSNGLDRFVLGAVSRSSDDYTIRPMTPREASRMCGGAATFSGDGARRVYVVHNPAGEAMRDRPTLVSGSTIAKAQEALERYERCRARDAKENP